MVTDKAFPAASVATVAVSSIPSAIRSANIAINKLTMFLFAFYENGAIF